MQQLVPDPQVLAIKPATLSEAMERQDIEAHLRDEMREQRPVYLCRLCPNSTRNPWGVCGRCSGW